MGWAAGERNLVFYADENRIVRRDHEWVQDTLTVTAALFRRIGIGANLKKTKTVVCMPGFIGGKWEGKEEDVNELN